MSKAKISCGKDVDSSQQPTQKTTPTKTENSAVEKEDHVKAREQLSDNKNDGDDEGCQ
jgi:hypothetical protein